MDLPEITHQRYEGNKLHEDGVENTSQFELQPVNGVASENIPELKQKAMLTIGKSGLNRDCEVCMERPKDTLFAPCGHVFAW